MKVQYIQELLYTHECVIVPGLGGFLTSYRPARIIKESNKFYPPSSQVAFNASLSENDGVLANYVSRENSISYTEALAEIRKWVDSSFRLMHSGGKLVLEDIGNLTLNTEGNLIFEPELRLNFLGNSFGLPTFYAKHVLHEVENINENQDVKRVKDWPSRLKYIVPETLKWAAVLAPFVAFALWGSMNTGKLNNYVQNYSGLFSWVRTTPGKTSTTPANTYHIPVNKEKVEAVVAPASILNKADHSFTPSAISYAAIKANGLMKKEQSPVAVTPLSACPDKYFIIGGAFREHGNALKLIEELKSKGYPAAIIDTTNTGMFVVSIKGFAGKNEALQEISSIRGEGYQGAWIMHKI
ncbi:MAG: HU-CCDC81 and SPOR domain-containing protein [Bacteroidetes bacterium]|nr:HU-CCDC81 and SPOR domain-containing protein [Bacteroidota bacterium]